MVNLFVIKKWIQKRRKKKIKYNQKPSDCKQHHWGLSNLFLLPKLRTEKVKWPTVKARSWPLKTQMPEMELSLFVPNSMTLAKAFLRSLSRRWNIPTTEQTRLTRGTVHPQHSSMWNVHCWSQYQYSCSALSGILKMLALFTRHKGSGKQVCQSQFYNTNWWDPPVLCSDLINQKHSKLHKVAFSMHCLYLW